MIPTLGSSAADFSKGIISLSSASALKFLKAVTCSMPHDRTDPIIFCASRS